MEPRVQYAQTEDGVNIAWTSMGDGPAVVFSANPLGDIDLYTSNVNPLADELVAAGRTVVLYDGRGTGYSDRDIDDFTLDSRLADLECVTDGLGFDRVALIGRLHGGPTAMAYAARHPESLTHLIVTDSYISGHEYYTGTPYTRAIRPLIEMAEEDWEFFTLTLANWMVGFRNNELARAFTNAFRAGMSARQYKQFVDEAERINLEPLLGDIMIPTLSILDRTVRFAFPKAARMIAASIRDAQFVTVTGPEETANAVLEFTGSTAVAKPSPPSTSGGTAIILFADIANSTALTEQLGDAAFREKARDLDEALRAAIERTGGTAIEGKLLGDGVLAVFDSARGAISCSSACHEVGAGIGLQLHIGLHAGDVIREDGNVFGGAVNIAARVSDASGAGETFVSATVRDLARTSAGVAFEDQGEHTLKGIDEPQRLFAVRDST